MARPPLQLVEVSKHFGDRLLFRNVTLEVPAGRVVAITGPNGTGKTTLLRAIAGLEAFSGKVVVAGSPIAPLGGGHARDCVLITQTPNLWTHLSCRENVALVRRTMAGESAAAARASSVRFLTSFGVETLGDRYPARLSGGEQQRVALARGFAVEKPVILLDEVTSSIDNDSRIQVAQAIRELASAGRAVVLVTHDAAAARLAADEILLLTTDGLRSAVSTEEE